MPPNTVKVCRPGKWGNPYKIGDDVPGLAGQKMDREDVVHWHYIAVINWSKEKAAESVKDLRGKNLACWCAAGKPCHADVLLELANDSGPNETKLSYTPSVAHLLPEQEM